MLKQSDIQGRLRLFRFGIIVVIAVTFVVSTIVPFLFLAPLDVGMGTVLTIGLLSAVGVGIILAVVYFGYRRVLLRAPAEATATEAAPSSTPSS